MFQPKLLIAAATLFAATAQAETLHFHATLNGMAEVPAKVSKGTGRVDAILDTSTKQLSYTASWSGLSGPATMGHFHGPAAAGANAPIAVPWGNDPASPFTGTATLTEQQAAELMAGRWYANIHTAQNPGGEIRGQMLHE